MAKKKPAPPAPKAKPPAPVGGGDHDFVRDLALILRETELTEIEVERNGLRVRVARQAAPAPMQMAYAPTPAAPSHAASPPQAPAPAIAPVTPAERAAHPGAIKSPMVGTAYQSPSPGAAAFIKVGDTVKEGQTLLIIEAMKTMNQIASTRAGRVIEILFRDAQPVEFGEVLVIVE